MRVFGSTKTITLQTSDAYSTDYSFCYSDTIIATCFATPADSVSGNVSTATTTTVLTSPASGSVRALLRFDITNRDSTNNQTVTIYEVEGANSRQLYQAVLFPGQTLSFDSNSGLYTLSPTGAGQMYIASGKLVRFNNSLSFVGTDGTTITFPTTSATIARTDAAQTFTGVQTFSSTIAGSINGNSATATTLATPRAINGVDFNGSAAISVPSDITPGTSGNVLTSNGTVWTSAAIPTLNQSTTGSANSLKSNATTGLLQIVGPAAGETRVITVPDADCSMARKDVTETFAGRVLIDDTTDATSTTDGSLQTDGGLSVAKKSYLGKAVWIADTTASTSATTGALVVGGGLGVGGTINQSLSSTGTTGPTIGMESRAIQNPTGTSDSNVIGIDTAAYSQGSNNNTNYISGIYSAAINSGTGTLTLACASRFKVSNTSSGIITESRSVDILSPGNTGTITTNIALNIDDQTVGATNYAIKTGTGLVKIGDTTASTSPTTGALTVAGGIGTNDKIHGPKFVVTEEGGLAVKVVAGENLVRGEVVYVKSTSGADGKVWKNPIDGDMPVGIVYANADADAEVIIITNGIAYVLPNAADTAVRGNVIFSSSTTAGRVDQAASTPAATQHFRECGHWLDTGSGAGTITRAIVHFN